MTLLLASVVAAYQQAFDDQHGPRPTTAMAAAKKQAQGKVVTQNIELTKMQRKLNDYDSKEFIERSEVVRNEITLEGFIEILSFDAPIGRPTYFSPDLVCI